MQTAVRTAVFLDRDGVINLPVVRDGRPYPPQSAEQLEWMAGVHETLRALRARNYQLFVITNQPDVARGQTTRAAVEAIHRRVLDELPIEHVYVCYHDDADNCACRKPKPGLILQASEAYGLDLSASWVVGDRWRDIEAGKAAGCRTLLVQHNYAERQALGFDAQVTRVDQLLDWIK